MSRMIVWLGLLPVCLPVATTSVAGAQEETPEIVQAREQFERGNRHLDAGEFDLAIAAFEKSHELAGRSSAIYMLAVSHRRKFETTGELDDARTSIAKYEAFLKLEPGHAKSREVHDTLVLLRLVVEGAEKRKKSGGNPIVVSGSREYRQALGLFGEARYAEAIEMAQAARKQATAGPEEVARIWLIIGRAQALSGSAEPASESMQKALTLDPRLRFEADIDAADVAAFEQARAELRGKAPLAVSADAKSVIKHGEELPVAVTVDSDPKGLVSELRLHYRRQGTDSFSTIVGADGFAFSIPVATLSMSEETYRVLYYVTAHDDLGAVIGTSGSARDPVKVEVLSEQDWETRFPEAAVIVQKKPLLPRWAWMAAGAVVAGGGLAIDLLAPTSENRELDALDFAPVGLYAAGGVFFFVGVF